MSIYENNQTKISTDKQLVDDIMVKYKDSVFEKERYELDVLLNLRYLNGDVYYYADGAYRVYAEYHAHVSDEVLMKENYNIIDSVRQEYVSRLTRTFPLIRTKPKTQNYMTTTKALITNKIIEEMEETCDIKNKYKTFCNGLIDTGTCGFIPYWDKNKGEIINYTTITDSAYKEDYEVMRKK